MLIDPLVQIMLTLSTLLGVSAWAYYRVWLVVNRPAFVIQRRQHNHEIRMAKLTGTEKGSALKPVAGLGMTALKAGLIFLKRRFG